MSLPITAQRGIQGKRRGPVADGVEDVGVRRALAGGVISCGQRSSAWISPPTRTTRTWSPPEADRPSVALGGVQGRHLLEPSSRCVALSGRVLDDAGAGGGVDGVASEDGMATSDPSSQPWVVGCASRHDASRARGSACRSAARDAPRKTRRRRRRRMENEGSRDWHACRAKPPSEVRRCPILGEA